MNWARNGLGRDLRTVDTAIAELKIWNVPKSKDFPSGRKFSLFLVCRGEVIVGMDNHKPKKHHYHINEKEFDYDFEDIDKLFDDFKKLAFIHLKVKL